MPWATKVGRRRPRSRSRHDLRATRALPARIVRSIRALHLLTGLVAPPRCAVCAAGCDAVASLCQGCERELTRGSGRWLSLASVDQAYAARPYEGVARELVHAIKFHRLLPVARRAAELIATDVPSELLAGTLVPVPPDPVRAAWRGFDAAELLAHELARRTDLPLSACLRRSHGPRQVGRRRRDRLAGPPRVAATDRPAAPLLVDDVTTTGATLAACATALRTAGCGEVRAVVLAAVHI